MGDVLIETTGPTIGIVTTGAAQDGRGHVNRAIALADALGDLGHAVGLQLIRGTLSPVERIRAAAADVTLLPATAPLTAGVVVVDLPDSNEPLRLSRDQRLVVFDDRDAFRGRAAIVVQPSQATWSGPGQADLTLAGAEHVPIDAAFRRLRAKGRTDHAPGEDSLVVACFGGSDPGRVGERLLAALERGPDWQTEIILGASYEGPTDGWPVAVVRDPPNLPERLAAADLLVLGAGTMRFQAACLGRPAILVAVADDQVVVGPPFAASGAAIYLGDGRTIDPERVRATIDALLRDPARREALGRRASEVVDGRGAERVAAAIDRLAVPATR